MTISLSRRVVLAGLGASALARDSSVQGAPSSGTVARGVVFEAMLGDGAQPRADRGLAGVMVSNGRDVVVTGVDGGWSLPVQKDDCIFVVKPAHFGLALQEGGTPFFYYRCEDGQPLPASIDFGLVRAHEPSEFQVLLLTDTQPDSQEELAFVRDDILAGVVDYPAAFAIHHGDVVGDALHLYARYRELLTATGITWHHCAGNHDIDRAAPDDAASRQTWKRTFGPRYYAFQHAAATFLVLDNVEYLGCEAGRYRGRFGRAQLAFVRKVLAQVPCDGLVVLSMHIPLRCYLAPDDPADTTDDYQELLALLRDHPHCVSFAGHLHATEHHYLKPAQVAEAAPHHHHVLTAACGSWWSGPRDQRGIPCADSTDGTPNGFHILHVDGNGYRTEFVPAQGERPLKFRAAVVPDEGSSSRGAGRLIVNVFDGGPRTRVWCRFAGQEWMYCDASAMRDPLICRLFCAETPRKAWVEPTVSSHIWAATIPPSVAKGTHRLTVRIVDEYGQIHEAGTLVEV